MTFSTRVRRTYLPVRRVKAECSARSYTEQESVLSAATCNLCAVAGISRSARLVCIPSKNFSNNGRRFNKGRLADDYYLPSAINETIGEVILAIDTSGSINNDDIAKVAAQIKELCETLPPERNRILWWDTQVHGEQVFSENYDGIVAMLKPMGGGGTRAGCVSDYIVKNNLSADCLIVFTDGHVENPVEWATSIPPIWIIKEGGNETFMPPVGQKVVMRA